MKEILIGSQIWMAENLNVDTFRNGDPIIQSATGMEWNTAAKYGGKPAWCYYNDDPVNQTAHGKLYNWFAVNDPRNIAPEGWHIPTDHEWQTLIDYLSGENEAGKKMKNNNLWINDDSGTNESGFSGLPSGFRKWHGSFSFLEIGETFGQIGMWWSSLEKDMNSAWYRYLTNKNYYVTRESGNKGMGLSVRCVKDKLI
jgi:uncharacterized protein (TIGR02145 family)